MVKKQWMRGLMTGLAIMLFAMGAIAQEKHIILIDRDVVQPAMMGQYMQISEEMAKGSLEHNYPAPYLCYSEDFEVEWVYIFENFSQLDAMHEKWTEFQERVGKEEVKDLVSQHMACVSQRSRMFAEYLPNLSYQPENPAFEFDKSKPFFCKVITYKIVPGKMYQVKEISQKLNNLCRENDIALGHQIYEVISGNDLPALLVAIAGEDEASISKEIEKRDEKIGEEIYALYKECAPYLRGMETHNLRYHPNLSYITW
ncbi:MAG: hypothetical protein JXR73_19230 [Candidatus Omnitrophica bacterium]|nr:hypothetical protein [Candidatus Omnitrophota bacterium]